MFDYFTQAAKQDIPEFKVNAIGKVIKVAGLTYASKGIKIPLGSYCYIVENKTKSGQIINETNNHSIAEVIGFDGDVTYLMPLERISNVTPGSRVVPLAENVKVPAGLGLLGRVLDGIGEPLDSKPLFIEDNDAISDIEWIDSTPKTINPLQREPINQPIDIGIRSINAMLTLGIGQRVGLFAGSGVGKSVLLGMMTKFTEVDVVVVALVGERGREVREFIEKNLGSKGMAKAIVVAAPADAMPTMRLKAGMYASRLCEYFRDKGMKALLLFDSLTRYAQAQREIALSMGEPPATRGYPPSVFTCLPELVERAGNGDSQRNTGSVTAIYTVLTEGDDMNDPVADAARSILDGHIVLSREIAQQSIYPAVDILSSVSRSMHSIVDDNHLELSAYLRQLMAIYQDSKDFISVGAYTQGADPMTDLAIAKQPQIRDFLRQGLDQPSAFPESLNALVSLLKIDSGVEMADNQSTTAALTNQSNQVIDGVAR